MSDNEEFTGFGEIDLGNLERECARHPKRVEKFGLLLEEAKAGLVEAEAEFDLVQAELRLRIVKRPEKFDMQVKPTEKTIDAVMETQKGFQEARKKRDQAKRVVAHLAVAINALDHRKKMIEVVADLFAAKYWSTPRVDMRTAADIGDKEVAERVRRRRRD
jgi:hypothetical protein